MRPVQLASNFSACGSEVSNNSLDGKQQKQLSSKNRHNVSNWCKHQQKQTRQQTRS